MSDSNLHNVTKVKRERAATHVLNSEHNGQTLRLPNRGNHRPCPSSARCPRGPDKGTLRMPNAKSEPWSKNPRATSRPKPQISKSRAISRRDRSFVHYGITPGNQELDIKARLRSFETEVEHTISQRGAMPPIESLKIKGNVRLRLSTKAVHPLLTVIEHKGAALPCEVKLRTYDRRSAEYPRKPRGI
jgi:hypothetical protein